MKLRKLFSINFFFIIYCIVGLSYVFFVDDFILFFYPDVNTLELSKQLQLYKVLAFFIFSLVFFYLLIKKRNEIIKNHIANIKKTQKQYLDLFNSTSHLFAILDKKGNYTYMSTTSEAIVGTPPEAFLNKHFFEIIHPDDVEDAQTSLNEILKKEKVVMKHYRVKNSKGKWLWIETVLENKLDKPTIKGVIVNSRNITENVEEKQHLKLLESVITNTKDAVLITKAEPFDEPGPEIIYVNEAFTKMTGYSSEEVMGKTPRILQGPKSSKDELGKLSKAIRKWKPYEITTINYKKNGEEFWVNFTVTPVANENGSYTHWIAIERDVTETITSKEKLIQAKEKAEENERKLNEAQKLAHLGSWYYDFTNKISYWSEETYNIWGLDPKNTTIDFLDHQKLIHPKDWDRFNKVINNAIEKKIPYKMELELMMSDGSSKIVNTIGKPVFGKGNQLVAFEGTTQDITTLVLKEKELKNAIELIEKNQYSMTQASKLAKIGFWEYEFSTQNLIWSDYIYLLYGFDPEKHTPSYEDSKSFFDNRSQQEINEATKKLLETGAPYDLELRLLNTNNQEIWVRNVVQPVYNENKEIIGKRGVIQNITEERYLRDLNREVARMVKIGSWSLDLEQEKIYWSEEIHRLHETDPKTYVPKLEEAINFYREDFRDLVKFNVENTIATGKPYDYEAIIITAKNNQLWVRAIGNAEFVNGKCVRLYGGFQEINEKKLAALELEKSLKSLEDYKYSLDQSAIIAFTDEKGVITYANDNFCKISGYSRAELIGNTHKIINASYHPSSFFIDLWKTIASGKIWRGEVKNKAKNGSYYWVDTTIVPFLNEKNRPNQYLAIRFDITERKNTTEQKNIFQRTLENSVNEIYIFDVESFKFSYVNKSALQNLGYTENEIKKLTPLDLYTEYSYQTFSILTNPLKNKKQEKIIFYTIHKRKDGSTYPVEIHLNLVEEENYKNFIAIVLDVSDRKKAEKMYRLLADNTNDIIALQDVTLKLKYISPAVTHILGYKSNDFLAKNLIDVIYKEDLEPIENAIFDKLLKGVKTEPLTYRVYDSKGNIVWLESLISPLIENGKITAIISSSRDITQWMIAKKEIQDYQTSLQKLTKEISIIEEKQKKEIAANIHDHLSQSLVISRIRIAELEKKPELKTIYEDLNFIKNHISNALENSRKITYELSPPVLYQLGIIDALDWLVDETKEKYKINFNFTSNVDNINLDELKSILIFRCVQEAITNSLKYAEASLITLDVKEVDDKIIVTLIDNGKGFDTEILNKNLSSASGFGLFAVNERIRNLNGELIITSETNIGTKVKICVPL